MPVFPQQSPTPVLDDKSQLLAPAAVISLKRVLEAETAAAVIVLAVWSVLDFKSNLRLAEFPVVVKVPVTV